MEADGSGAGIEGAGIGSDDALTEVGDLKALVAQVVFAELGHGPVEQDGSGFGVIAEAFFDLFACGRFANPGVVGVGGGAGAADGGGGPQRIAQAAGDVAHGAGNSDVVGSEGAHFGFAARVVVPKLDAGAIEEGNEESVDRGSPLIATPRQVEF